MRQILSQIGLRLAICSHVLYMITIAQQSDGLPVDGPAGPAWPKPAQFNTTAGYVMEGVHLLYNNDGENLWAVTSPYHGTRRHQG